MINLSGKIHPEYTKKTFQKNMVNVGTWVVTLKDVRI